jgi:hypothetical protein
MKPYVYLNYAEFVSSNSTSLAEWQLLTLTFNGTYLKMYKNGQIILNTSASSNPSGINRTKCFIGKSNWAGNGFSKSYLDDLRFYNKSLTQEEILQLMNTNNTGLIFKLFTFLNFE